MDRFLIYPGRSCTPTRVLLERCAPGARVVLVLHEGSSLALVSWRHMNLRLERVVHPPERCLEPPWSVDVEPGDLDGRAKRFVRRLAWHWAGTFTDGRGWWDGSGRLAAASLTAWLRPSACPRRP